MKLMGLFYEAIADDKRDLRFFKD